MTTYSVPVIIVGGGLVGLSAALFLNRQGISYLLAERHSGTSIHPRSRGFNLRTMELYRNLGLEQAIREAGASLSKSKGMFTAETLASAELDLPQNGVPESTLRLMNPFVPNDDISPTQGNRCTQDVVEPLLLQAARDRGGDLRFSTELRSFRQDIDGVTAELVDRATGTASTVRARYLIAADGAKSPVRQALGISMTDEYSHGFLINIYFQADLRDMVQGHEFSICNILHPEATGMLVAINNSDRWCFHAPYDPQNELPEDYTPERCKDLLAKALGFPGLDIRILSVLPWEAAEGVAERFQSGRVFLAGDAAHVMPPTGGFGANTGVQDAHNLAWKLAAVLRGHAGPGLLETYEDERRPVARFTAKQAGLIAANSMLSFFKGRTEGTPANVLVTAMGYRYKSTAVLASDDSEAPQDQPEFHAAPGTRAPHVWVGHRSGRISTLDLFERSFVLVAGPDGASWRAAAETARGRLGIGIDCYLLGPDGDLADPDGLGQQAFRLSPGGAVLVRPDGFVAWRSDDGGTDDYGQTLVLALMQILSRESGGHPAQDA
ncbi:FAD-dependent monooxygenase [Paenibacillus oleatilyticus]|uniref:FAD-dependent monooxygenase n=1 Tax=Paenibacillus oleatilyticus TaxID=2594886 RepID=UPI001C1F86B2|nr:FAD-dependent monooxygenase [Paenibacillus oleatilyticus]MBU7316258.1 FAD-dependent oxidoreductase [Paenibacillus oleatilyticus]